MCGFSLCSTCQGQDDSLIDQYLVCGKDYKAVRDAVAKVMVEGKAKRLDAACKVILFCLTSKLRQRYLSNNHSTY